MVGVGEGGEEEVAAAGMNSNFLIFLILYTILRILHIKWRGIHSYNTNVVDICAIPQMH